LIDLSQVFVTGIGAACAAGCGRDSLARAFHASRPLSQTVDRSAGFHRDEGARLASLASDVDLSAWLSAGESRRMSRPSKLAVAAARMAIADAGLDLGNEAATGAPTGVVLSNSYGPTSLVQAILEQIGSEGPLAVSPALFTESVANAPAAQVAIACRASGPNLTVTQREAGAIIALSRGATLVAGGRVDRVLVLSVDELTPLLHAILDRFDALAREIDSLEEASRPFDRRRNGFLAGEGCVALLLESRAALDRRDGRPLARVLSFGSAFDPEAPRIGWGTSSSTLAPGLRKCLAKADISPQALDCIVSGASGSVAGDRLEAEVLSELWSGRQLPPVLVPKAVIGEQGGALLGAAVLRLLDVLFGATPGFADVDPTLGVVPHDGRPIEETRTLLVTSLAVGGAAAWVVLGAFP
jgi:3-oxoacyl-[acyl-carrier-protein] synthase II